MPPTDTASDTVADALARLRETRGRMTPGEATITLRGGMGFDLDPYPTGIRGMFELAADAQGIAALVNATDALLAVAEAAAGLAGTLDIGDGLPWWGSYDPELGFGCHGCGFGGDSSSDVSHAPDCAAMRLDAALAAIAGLNRPGGLPADG